MSSTSKTSAESQRRAGILTFISSLSQSFGSYENWEKDFKATGSMRGIGWCVLYQDSADNRLMNFWINEHDVSHPAGCNPIIVMDVFEHAFMTDYGLKRADYLEAFMKNINWPVVEARIDEHLKANAEGRLRIGGSFCF